MMGLYACFSPCSKGGRFTIYFTAGREAVHGKRLTDRGSGTGHRGREFGLIFPRAKARVTGADFIEDGLSLMRTFGLVARLGIGQPVDPFRDKRRDVLLTKHRDDQGNEQCQHREHHGPHIQSPLIDGARPASFGVSSK